MKYDTHLHVSALALWNIQDSLLQWYRSIFVTSQSLLISFAATVATSDKHRVLAIPLAAIGALMWTFWKRTCTSRGHDVSFCQWILLRCEFGLSQPEADALDAGLVTSFKAFQDTKQFAGRALLQDKDFHELLQSPTRIRMDRHVPNAFGAVWVALVVFLAYRLLP